MQWISVKQDEPDISLKHQLKLQAISHEVEGGSIGFSAYFFTINYQFLGSVKLK